MDRVHVGKCIKSNQKWIEDAKNIEGSLKIISTYSRINSTTMDDLKDWVISISEGWSFTFRVADALELHGT